MTLATDNRTGPHEQPYFAHRIEGARQIEQLNESNWPPIRLEAMVGRMEITGARKELLCLWHTRASEGYRIVPKYEADLVSIRFITQGCLLRRNTRETFIGQSSRAILVGFGEMREEQASRAFESLGGTISREALVAGHQVLEGGSAGVDLRFEPVVDVASLPMRALMQTFLTLHGRLGNSLSQDDILFPLLEEILVYQLLSSWPRRGTLASGRAQVATSRHVRTAMDYIDAHIAERLTLAEVAKAARSSVRALQVAFRNELGTTPFGYIIDLRLDRVYADLASHGGSQSIKVVAGRWGFVHMSDFTKRFRQRFGHVPSETQWKSKIAAARPPSRPQ